MANYERERRRTQRVVGRYRRALGFWQLHVLVIAERTHAKACPKHDVALPALPSHLHFVASYESFGIVEELGVRIGMPQC